MDEQQQQSVSVEDVATPCFVVDIDIVQQNAEKMIAQCRTLGVKLRPHMKTHKCLKIGEMATGGTKRTITVSTLSEAEFYAENGFDDIVFASLFTSEKLPRMKALALRLNEFHVFADCLTTLELLDANRPSDNKKWSVLVKVDCGASRAGVVWDSDDGLLLARRITGSQSMTFAGLYAHEGNSYHVKGVDDVKQIGEQSAERILDLANRIRQAGIECRSVGLGSTPTASLPADLMKDITELHPGNYLFYDSCQALIGACRIDEVAVRVYARVIGHYPHRKQLLIDAGWTAMSLDGHGEIPNGSYCLFEDEPLLRLVKMTQEVGFVDNLKGRLDYNKYPIGTLLRLIPFHSCATACMHPDYLIKRGDKIVDKWQPIRGW